MSVIRKLSPNYDRISFPGMPQKAHLQKLVFILWFLTATFSTKAQVKDHLSVPGPIQFDSVAYALSWSSHPTDNYYKHEYLPKGADPDKFNQMLLVEFVAGKWKAMDVLDEKVRELDQLKRVNPVVNYAIFKNATTGDLILDFLVSKNSPDGKTILFAERNVYRYKKITIAGGQDGVLLFGVSVRSYGDAIMNFVSQLKDNRKALIDKVGHFTLPDITVAP